MDILRLRIKSCLQTLLELQPAMKKKYRTGFAEDFSRLQAYLRLVDGMTLGEAEVERLEALTASFIHEVEFNNSPLAHTGRLQ